MVIIGSIETTMPGSSTGVDVLAQLQPRLAAVVVDSTPNEWP
jgi:hypothetical protein